ncbi:HPr family phosphocarrier protein [Ohessyouella blattaphilus]|uniref:HPr family phosphocarrier protein n=1 Tax=Ohessyouella blattaphilus TaxID=2949333 RepID=A0ABT1EK45_9FIRM|nr:HPr family phosphocarrier protein [Ohessyouella blattaphilus]MCP1110854.1 HPr family phosphocarrier protein [Ohessyouella blattaphilus]MCR8564248.1 HPr family phosphocarrier protein [Ohessyouella blattaphilus]
MINRKVKVTNPSGLHMRPAGVFVKVITGFESEVTLRANGDDFNAKSMLGVLSASIKCGDEVELIVCGADEEACMKAAVEAIESGLGE